jgi:predicted double-glycine peptidase
MGASGLLAMQTMKQRNSIVLQLSKRISQLSLRCCRWTWCCLLLTTPGQSVFAGNVLLDLDGGVYQVPVTSVKERRYQTVMKQQYDYSCGSAAVATLLRYHYDFELDSGHVFESMYQNGDQEQINRLGFSLLDIKNYLVGQGFEAGGFRLGLDQFLQQAAVPAIVMIQTDNYKHFVVLKGVRDDKVLLGDPASGLKIVSRAQFEKEWEGIFFIITNEAAAGRDAFNREDEWALLAKAQVTVGVRAPDLGEFLLSLPGGNDF